MRQSVVAKEKSIELNSNTIDKKAFMKTVEDTRVYQASPEKVFDCLDDLGVTGMHMTESSMPMMGGKMHLEFLTANKTGLHTKYRWTGRVLWWPLDFTVKVTKWEKGKEKVWETIGITKLVIYSWFRMNLNIFSIPNGSFTRLSISYKKPAGFFNRIVCFVLGNWYCRWCIKNMLKDTENKLMSAHSVSSTV